MTGPAKLRLATILALSGSAVLHVAAMAISPANRVEIEIEGGQAPEMAALGSSFADLVRSSNSFEPVTTDDDADPVATDVLRNDTPSETIDPVEPVETTATTVPETVLAPSEIPSASTTPIQPVKTAASTEPQLIKPLEAETVAPVSPEIKQAKTSEVQPAKPTEVIESVKKPKPVPKPKPKPKQKPKPKPKAEKAKKQTKSSKKAGNSNIDSKAGSQKGKASTKASPSGNSKSKSTSRKTGNAAVSNYPGKVYSKIARTRQKRAGGRGVARVSFQVSPNGRATGVSLAKSSGNKRVDNAAIAHVKRASPFPKPPAGARTRFVIPIEFRR